MSARTPAIAKPATPAPAQTQEQLAAALTAQWSRAQAGLVEIIRFGAMLSQVARQLEAPTRSPAGERVPGHGWNKGTGLKAWLAEHCPGINYKTAFGYMVAANGLAREARLAEDVPLLSLMGEDPIPEPRAEKLRARVYKVLADASLSLLKAAGTSSPPPLPTGGPRDGAGRPTKTLADPDVQLEEALRCALRLTDMVRSWAIDEDGLGTLPDGPLETFLANMGDVCKRGREILSGRAAASKRRL